jgi:hypothetical protein
MTARKKPRPADGGRLIDVFELSDAAVEALRDWGIRTVADVLAAAGRQYEARARARSAPDRHSPPGKPFDARAEVALLVFHASFFRLHYCDCRKAAAAILAAEGGAR